MATGIGEVQGRCHRRIVHPGRLNRPGAIHGELTASALVAAVGDFGTFKSARQFASWVGLTPRQVGTGGKTQQLGISKRGDSYLRTLLISGARAVIARAEKTSWMQQLLQRRHCNVVVVALANKIARTVWAVLAKGAAFDLVKWHPIEPVTADTK